ncbi:MAG: asparagine synthase (glutamine-hydrolyzing) [Desulfobacterales bacterium]|nr:asparagine synthase (glutamine-hydrolyzing) [Desulfobacterales bacterium]
MDGSPIDTLSLDRFTDSLAHRGPDGRGIYIDPHIPVGLGHRRLAILDTSSTGHQPMSFGNGRYWITYNGEIYNFLELREELESLGHRFISDSDTEVILAAYVHWGENCQFKLNGMWAFAIWDAQDHVFFLSRDRFGVKPLHYYYDGQHFAFASEMKAFLQLKWFHPSFDPHMVALALTEYTYVEGAEKCLIHGINRLKAGYCLSLRQGQAPRIKRWWNTLEHLEVVSGNFQEQADHFRELFLDACKIRMRSDVPVGTALSGGLDSSSVLCSMAHIRSNIQNGQRLAEDWQKAFVAAFPGTSQDESYYAGEVIRHTGAHQIYKDVDPAEIIEHIDDVLFQIEEIHDITPGPWLIYRAQRRDGIVVSIDGHGGDELLAGYHFYPRIAMQDLFAPWPRVMKIFQLRSILKDMVQDCYEYEVPSFKELARRSLLQTKHTLSQNLQKWPGIHKPASFIYHQFLKKSQPFGKPPVRNPQGTPSKLLVEPEPVHYPDFECDLEMMPSHFDSLNRILYFDFHFKALPTILRNFDRCSMAHGVEIRSPFMDWRLVSYSFSLTSANKLGGGYSKRILREAMRGILPELIRTRKSKIGFCYPFDYWWREPMKTFMLDSVNTRDFLQSDIWNGPVIRDFVETSYKGNPSLDVLNICPYIQASRLMTLFKERRP